MVSKDLKMNTPAIDYVAAVLARSPEEAELYRRLLQNYDIPAVLGELPGRGRLETGRSQHHDSASKNVPVLVPEPLLDEASQIIAGGEDELRSFKQDQEEEDMELLGVAGDDDEVLEEDDEEIEELEEEEDEEEEDEEDADEDDDEFEDDEDEFDDFDDDEDDEDDEDDDEDEEEDDDSLELDEDDDELDEEEDDEDDLDEDLDDEKLEEDEEEEEEDDEEF